MEPLKTTEEIADYLRVEVVTVRRLATRGELPAYRVGGEFRFIAQEIQDFVKDQRVSNPGDRFDKFTARARKVLNFAILEAEERKHDFIGPEHFLLGLLREGEGVAVSALTRAGLRLDEVRQSMQALMDKLKEEYRERPEARLKAGVYALRKSMGLTGNLIGEPGLTVRARKAIELAIDEARRMGHRYIGTEHLLLGIIQEREGPAADVLVGQYGLTLDAMRSLVLQILSETSTMSLPEIPEQAATLLSENEQGVTCGRCGAQSPGYFRFCFHCGLKLPSRENESPSRLSQS